MSHRRLLALATLFAAVAFLVLVLRIAYPHHRQLALTLYGIGWLPFLLSIRRLWIDNRGHAERILRWKHHILVGSAFLLFAWAFKVLIPVENSPLLNIDAARLPETIDADLQHLTVLDSKMQDLAGQLQEAAAIESDRLSPQESKHLREVWSHFVEASLELDLLKMRYRAFYQVNGFTYPRLHAKAFLVGYGALVSQYLAASMATAEIGHLDGAKKLLDDAHPADGIAEGSFAHVQWMVSHPDEILRLNAGRAYLLLMKRRLDRGDLHVNRVEEQLSEITRMALTDVDVFVTNPLDVLEHQASNAWYPVQKGVALGMASFRTVSREYFITPENLESAADRMIPGDIMLTRREWHLTNLGIPGYWTHAALHLGSIEQMDRYFEGLEQLDGKAASEVIQGRHPDFYAALQRLDASGKVPSVIEALKPGVIVQSLQRSATADSLAVLRPRVSRADRWQAVLAALPHFGKPYNYQFDFRVDSALVCSQLVYKAYETTSGLRLQPKINSGRLLLSPNELAIKYDREADSQDAELELVLFLDGSDVGAVVQRSAQEFRASWSRPKWHIVFQDATQDTGLNE